MDLPTIGPFLGPVVIPAVLQALKRAGLPSNYAPVGNLALSALWVALAGAIVQNPELADPVVVGLNVALTLLTGWGLYEGALWAGRSA